MATIRKRDNGVWELNYVELDGRRIRKSLGKIRKDYAKAELDKVKIRLLTGKMNGQRVTGKIKYKDWNKRYLNWYERTYPSTYYKKRDNFINHIDDLFDQNPNIHTITLEMVDDFVQDLSEKGLAPATINTVLSDLRAFLNRAAKLQYTAPDIKIEDIPDNESKPVKFHSNEDLQKLYDSSPNHWHWWKLMVNTGMRLGELRRLKIENIKDDYIEIISTNKARNKSGKYRVVGLNDDAKIALSEFDQSGEFLFPEVWRSSVGTALTRCCKRAGIKKGKWGVHVLRHTFGSHLAMAGVDLASIGKLMGHRDIKTTMIYVHLTPDHLRSAVKSISL